jgi:hypothetical protein
MIPPTPTDVTLTARGASAVVASPMPTARTVAARTSIGAGWQGTVVGAGTEVVDVGPPRAPARASRSPSSDAPHADATTAQATTRTYGHRAARRAGIGLTVPGALGLSLERGGLFSGVP